MAAILELPPRTGNEHQELIDALDALLNPALSERNVQQIGWWITDAYMQGVRSFDNFDFDRGELDVSYESEDGALHMRWEEPATRLQTEVGRLSRLDTRALVEKVAHSIESLRDSSLAQAIFNHVESGDAEQEKIRFLYGLCMYGTYGLASWDNDESDNPMEFIKEMIPPWELLGFPAGTMNPTDVRAIGRTRLFPIVNLMKMPNFRMPPDKFLDKLDIVELPYGAEVGSRLNPAGTGPTVSPDGLGGFDSMFDEVHATQSASRSVKSQLKQPRRRTEKFVRMREFWALGPDNTINRYLARAGNWVGLDIDYRARKERVPFPIGIARYDELGRFYGGSFMGRIIPMAMEIENLMEALITNMADLDRFGFLMVPTGLGIDLEAFKDSTDEPRIVTYTPDINEPQLGVNAIQPVNASDVPGKVAQFMLTAMDRVVAQGPLFSGTAPGRADSGEAFNTLAETGSTGLIPVGVQIESAYSTRYRWILHSVSRRLQANPDAIQGGLPLTKIENSIAGVSLDPATGRLKLDPQGLPDAFAVNIGIASRDPNGGDRRRQEAIAFLDREMLSPLEFIVMSYREGWNYPVGNRGVWDNYIKAVLLNLIMFNDGTTVGELPFEQDGQGVIFNPNFDKAEVHLMAVEDFVSGPEFALASPEIQDAFFERIATLKAELGQTVPPQAPTIDQAAIQQAAAGGQLNVA